MRKIFFRADAGPVIGYGHFTRSLALADMLKEDFDCTFFTQSPTTYQCSEMGKVCKYVSLPSDDSKFGIFLNMLSGDEIVFLDNYFFTLEYERAIKAKGCRLVNLDSGRREYCCDLIFSFISHSFEAYTFPAYTKAFSGLEWFILREPFRRSYDSRKRIRERVVIAFGGTDQFGFTEKVVDLLESHCPSCLPALIATSAFPEERRRFLKARGVELHIDINAEEVADLFASSGTAVVSASTICVEALSRGCRVIAGHYMPDQVKFCEYLENENLISAVGDLRSEDFSGRMLMALNDTNAHCRIMDFSRQKEMYVQQFKQIL